VPLSINVTYTRAINRLHSTYGMSYPSIARETGIPPGTLWDIANGKPVPRKWRKPVYRDLFAMPVRELRWAIENRR
jgi:hypothetical protein